MGGISCISQAVHQQALLCCLLGHPSQVGRRYVLPCLFCLLTVNEGGKPAVVTAGERDSLVVRQEPFVWGRAAGELQHLP